MADRPQVSGWQNINLNKPEEYSSEFTRDGLTYANVTNVTTGQRQLYFVSGLPGSPITQRSLLSTTNADGKITVGAARDDFIRRFGKDKLDTAEKLNKQQSVKLLSTPGLSTQPELTSIKDSKEFKSSNIGNNKASDTEKNEAKLTEALKTEEPGTRNEFPGKGGSNPLVYPTTLRYTDQDVIKFRMVKYAPKKLDQNNKDKDLSPFQKRRKITDEITIGTVILPIPSGISDSNAASWSSNETGVFQSQAYNIANAYITGGGEAGTETTKGALEGAQNNSGAIGTGLANLFAESASGTTNMLSRTKGAVYNTNMELLFNGPSLRPFTFVFKLSARRATEAEEIRKIIRFFKQGMSPIRTQSQLFLKAPHTFQLDYLHKGKQHNYLNKFKECALQSFSVDYTPEGQYATFYDGAMVSYQITMQFQELEPIFNDDYGNAQNAPDTEIGY